ncbi:MAG: NlpC/P60 family protein [Candidatus Paceibacterota bacterium]|jgi:hypothetical protein
MDQVNSSQVPNFQYKIGFSLQEFNTISGKNFKDQDVENLLLEKGFEFKKVIVEEILRQTIPLCMNAEYKNPSSMRLDAPNAFSCSSLISYLYTQAGVWMPSLSIDKYVFGVPILEEDLKFGDLIFANSGIGLVRTETVEYLPGSSVPEGIDHVVMYLGQNKILHATKKYEKVVEESLDNLKSISKIVGFRRVADTEEERFVVDIPKDRTDLKIKINLIKQGL